MKTKGEIVFFAVCVAFFGFMGAQAVALMGEGRAGEIGSALWPLISLCAALGLSAVLLIQAVRRPAAAPVGGEASEPDARDEARRRRKAVFASTACFFLYLVAISFLGFILATLLFIPAFAIALGERRTKVLVAAPLILTTVMTAVFIKFLTIPFPKGVGVFAAFSRLFY